MSKDSKITIWEIARMANVSPTTVSRVINHPEIVNEETRNRVLSCIKESDYQPNPFAQGMHSKRSRIVALVVPNFTTLSFANLAKGIQDRLLQSNYSMVIFSSHEDEELEKKICRKISELRIDGVIFASSMMPNYDELSKDIAKVFIDRDGTDVGIDTFLLDVDSAMDKLVVYLKEKNHRNIGLVAGDPDSYSGGKKTTAFRKALINNGLSVDEERIAAASWSSQEGWRATEELLEAKNRPTALIVATDTLAVGVIGAITSKGYKVPEDISVVGFNNEPGSESMNPPMTTMQFDDYGMGQEVADAILNRIEHPESAYMTKTYSMDIIERKTVNALDE